MRTVGILYPGEMGSAVARLLTAHGVQTATCAEGRSARTRSLAQSGGVALLPSIDDVVARADVVISLVSPSGAVEVAKVFAAAVRRTGRCPTFLDANSVSPTTVGQVQDLANAVGCECVDGAFVGGAAALGATTTLVLSGAQAAHAGSMLEPCFRVRILSPSVGDASAFKLSFAGFNKGLVALYLEAIGVAQRIGCRPVLEESLREFYPGTVKTIERLLPSYPRHAARRAEEMGELRVWMANLGEGGWMAAGTQAVLEEFATLEIPLDTEGTLARLIEEYCLRRARRGRSGADAGSQ